MFWLLLLLLSAWLHGLTVVCLPSDARPGRPDDDVDGPATGAPRPACRPVDPTLLRAISYDEFRIRRRLRATYFRCPTLRRVIAYDEAHRVCHTGRTYGTTETHDRT